VLTSGAATGAPELHGQPAARPAGLPAFPASGPPTSSRPSGRSSTEPARVEEILAAAEPPRWDNLVVPLEALEHRLARVWAPVGHLNAVQNTEALRKAYNACLPLLSDYSSELGQHEGLFRAFERVLAEEGERLAAGQRKILEDALRDFRLAGVACRPGRGRGSAKSCRSSPRSARRSRRTCSTQPRPGGWKSTTRPASPGCPRTRRRAPASGAQPRPRRLGADAGLSLLSRGHVPRRSIASCGANSTRPG
jgi:hypothetical protein